MRISELPSPGVLSMGIRLRRDAANAIGSIEMAAARTPGGKTQGAKQLQAFFQACADELDSFQPESTLPVFSSAKVEDGYPAEIVVTMSKACHTSVLPAPEAFTLGGTHTTDYFVISAAFTNPLTLVLQVGEEIDDNGTPVVQPAEYANGDTITVAYTAPAQGGLQDGAGQKVLTWAAKAVTNNVQA